MTVGRLAFLLAAALAVLLGVVVLRAETTRLHYELSRLDREAFLRYQQLRDRELQANRLRSPQVVQQRLRKLQAAQWLDDLAEEEAGAAQRAGRGDAVADPGRNERGRP